MTEENAGDKAVVKPHPRYTVKRAARLVVFTYGCSLLFLFFGQGWLIFPGRTTQGSASSVVRPGSDRELIRLTTASGDKIVAVFGAAFRGGKPDPNATKRLTVLLFYGNAMCLQDALTLFEDFRSLDINVLMPEYVGYGMSEGSPSEANCYATADAAYAYLLTRKDMAPNRIVAAGWSLGGAVAIDLASRKPVVGLITFSTFTRMAEAAANRLRIFPVSLLLLHRFENETKIAKLTCPIFLGHGTRDNFVPFEMRDRLAAAAKGPVTLLSVEGASHADVFIIQREKTRDALRAFLSRL